MYPLDEEKFTLMIEGDNFCYKIMSFGLKNVNAAYGCFYGQNI